jgi:hypothetical protein
MRKFTFVKHAFVIDKIMQYGEKEVLLTDCWRGSPVRMGNPLAVIFAGRGCVEFYLLRK